MQIYFSLARVFLTTVFTLMYKRIKGQTTKHVQIYCVCFVFVALRPMSTAMVIAGRSVHLTTLFPGQA